MYLPSSGGDLTFKHLKPTSYVVSDALSPLPSHVTKLRFDDGINHPSLLPFHFLRLIRIEGYYQRFQYLPSTITHITFGKSFNHTINRILPPSLTHLTFGEQYNSSVRYLPDNITHLTFGYSFNLPVDHLPHSITHLTFGEKFSQPLTHLPHALQVLKLGQSFHHQLESMPNSIHTLTTYNRASINSLPSSLTRLEHHSTTNNLNCTLPSSLTHLHLSGGGPSLDLSNLPLKHLEIDGTDDFNPNLNTLPTTLQRLDLRKAWNGPLDSLPSSLTQLNIASHMFNHPLDHFLRPSPAYLYKSVIICLHTHFTTFHQSSQSSKYSANMTLHFNSTKILSSPTSN